MRLDGYKPSEGVVLAWDGKRPDPLYVESRETLALYAASLPRPVYLVMKAGSETLIHKGNTSRTDYSIHRLVGEAIDAKERGLGVTIVYSGVCALGRIIRNRKGEYIGRDELEERRKDAVAGEDIIKGMIYRFSLKAGEEPVFVDVRPEDFLSADGRRKHIAVCLSNMAKSRTVWVNEKDALRELAVYGSNTFNENDTLASLVAQETYKHTDAPTGLLILMDRRGFLPREIIINRGFYAGPEDSYVIRLVTDPTGLEGEAVAQKLDRITRGGPVTKIKAAGVAARSGVPVWVGSGMFHMHDSSHMRTMESRTPTPKRHNPVSSVLDTQPFGTLFVPSGLYDEGVKSAEKRELVAV